MGTVSRSCAPGRRLVTHFNDQFPSVHYILIPDIGSGICLAIEGHLPDILINGAVIQDIQCKGFIVAHADGGIVHYRASEDITAV